VLVIARPAKQAVAILSVTPGENRLNGCKREKEIKAGSRKKKEELINGINSEWHDLYEQL
jgi:predicted GIY-YIG superfamily endonuclease